MIGQEIEDFDGRLVETTFTPGQLAEHDDAVRAAAGRLRGAAHMKVIIVLRKPDLTSAHIEVPWPDGVRVPVKGEILLMAPPGYPDGMLLVDGPVDYVTWEWIEGELAVYLHVRGS